MTFFREDATVCVTREQYDEAVRRGDPAPMLLGPIGQPQGDPGDECDGPCCEEHPCTS